MHNLCRVSLLKLTHLFRFNSWCNFNPQLNKIYYTDITWKTAKSEKMSENKVVLITTELMDQVGIYLGIIFLIVAYPFVTSLIMSKKKKLDLIFQVIFVLNDEKDGHWAYERVDFQAWTRQADRLANWIIKLLFESTLLFGWMIESKQQKVESTAISLFSFEWIDCPIACITTLLIQNAFSWDKFNWKINVWQTNDTLERVFFF